jgi:hypothetical protein
MCPQGAAVGGRRAAPRRGHSGDVPQHVGPAVGITASSRDRPQPKREGPAAAMRRDGAPALRSAAPVSLSAHTGRASQGTAPQEHG